MADTEEVIGRTEDGRIIVYWENVGPTSYTSGGFDVSIGTLRAVERIAELGNNGGFRTEPEECTISGNTITIPIHYHAYACAGTPMCATGWEPPDGRDFSKNKFSGIVIGH